MPQCATGVLTIPAATTVTGTVVVTDLAFQPKALILWHSGRSDTSDASGENDLQYGMGFAVSATSRATICIMDQHAAGTTATADYNDNTNCVIILDTATGNIIGSADLTSLDASGFTLDVTDQFPADLRVSWIALGGADLTDVYLKEFTVDNSTTGTKTITGVPFQPDAALFLSTFNSTTPPTVRFNGLFMFSATDGTNQAILAARTRSGQASSYCKGYCLDAAVGTGGEIVCQIGTATDLSRRTSFTGFTSDGFTLEHTEGTAAESIYVWGLCLKGGNYMLGNFATATNTTPFTETSVGFQPSGAIFASANRTENTQDLPVAQLELSIGAAVSGTNRSCQYARSKDNVADADCFTAIEHDAIYVNGSADATQVIEGLGDLNSFDSDGMTLQMDDADPLGVFVWYMAFGVDAGAVNPLTVDVFN